ncbi:DUF125-domain-containing protein [Aaosphaeria arxii CBS 175.79]|uniref:DUF125-domain-containing protein n=1 Tax=Aaosphaeria arxii CBS 175.79 TaxID=1450172 RepID=A0A6A5Y6M2_9PLEO|nr:DUF125-domain-containing protein [Aaosphaeria arxii CBS 175.79]KAF2020391.1 DUF125-domain-containing protein [Aaosphaeria arxii CBS 175.79]
MEDITTLYSPSTRREATRPNMFDSRTVSDATVGLADGLTVPFALTAGLSALGNPQVVVYGGLAELFAGAISMSLGGYLGGKHESDAHHSLIRSTSMTVHDSPSDTALLVHDMFLPYALPSHLIDSLADHIISLPANLQVEFIMNFHHKKSTQESDRAIRSAMTIGLGYFAGGAIPLLPYVLAGKDSTVYTAFWWSCIVMVMALFAFGAVKMHLLSDEPLPHQEGFGSQEICASIHKKNFKQYIRAGVEMVILGSFAAGAAMGIVSFMQ